MYMYIDSQLRALFYVLQVQVVQEKSTKEVYAMKIMKKAHILQQADVSLSIAELVRTCIYISKGRYRPP